MVELAGGLQEIALALIDPFTNAGSRINVLYLLSATVIAYFLYVRIPQERRQGFIRFLLPRSIWIHPSHLLDLKLLMVDMVVKFTGATSRLMLVTMIVVSVASPHTVATDSTIEITPVLFAQVVLLSALVSDFCTYWVHRIHHTQRILWPLHKLHHSAEVMTPFTLYRKHPLYDVINTLVKATAAGLLQAVMMLLLGLPADAVLVGGAYLVYVMFNLFGSNLRHTHIWFSFGRVLSHLLVSPAMHQIHHSRRKEHINNNYGEIFAVWDWLFGSLYIPKRYEKLKLGLSEWESGPVVQPHTTLRAALLLPLIECWQEIRKETKQPLQP